MLSTARIANLGDALWEATHAFPTETAFIEANRDRVNGVWTHGEVRAHDVGDMIQPSTVAHRRGYPACFQKSEHLSLLLHRLPGLRRGTAQPVPGDRSHRTGPPRI